jgi:hypothetical protein
MGADWDMSREESDKIKGGRPKTTLYDFSPAASIPSSVCPNFSDFGNPAEASPPLPPFLRVSKIWLFKFGQFLEISPDPPSFAFIRGKKTFFSAPPR